MAKIRTLMLVLVIFSIGWLLNTVLTNFVYYDAEKPLSFGFVPFLGSPERLSPSDHIQESQIQIYDDKVVIATEGARWAAFTDTNSMDPFLDESSNSIEIAPKSPNDIKPGDIISYRSGITGYLVVHRVISRDVDDHGVFYIVKGDNNPTQDPEKVRFEQVNGVLIGIIY
ncbi:signal peptidase I [Candidatus Woesearchaeota archaeon]|nr:signal peptidase I [Candidatus Woesearchaeota archaeon]